MTGDADDLHLHGSVEDHLWQPDGADRRAVQPAARRTSPGRGAWTLRCRLVSSRRGSDRTEPRLIHVLWLTSGLSCDGDTVSMTAATSPSLEDLLTGVDPGHAARSSIYNALLAYETGEDFVRAFAEAAERPARARSCSCVEGSIPNEEINGDGHWAGFGVDPETGQPIPTTTGSTGSRRGPRRCWRSARARRTAASRR